LVSLATENNSLTHYTKGTQSPLRAPTACTHTVSGSISLPSPGFFSPFPHGTCSLSVGREYLALEDGSGRIARVPPYSLSVIGLCFRLQGYHLLWPAFPDCSASTHQLTPTGLFPVRSPLLRESRLISIPPVTEMFQFTGFALNTYLFSAQYHLRGGFPHSEIAGSKLVCQLPDAYRRLLRPSSPSTA
jgi:hypothetical protein